MSINPGKILFRQQDPGTAPWQIKYMQIFCCQISLPPQVFLIFIRLIWRGVGVRVLG